VLDIACGGGRHSHFLLAKGYEAVAVDRDMSSMQPYAGTEGLSVLEADLEKDAWPFAGHLFAGIVVVNYLWRPLFPDLLASLAPAGILIYDTFAVGNEKFGRPRNPDFLLQPNELKDLCKGLEIVDYTHGETKLPPALRQSIVARRLML